MISKVNLVDFGICEVTNESAEASTNSSTGYFLYGNAISFLNKTDTIKIQQGLAFGIQYVLKGVEQENAEVFEVKIIHPLLVNPGINTSCTEVIETKIGCIDETNFDYFRFEYDWEMKPGKWLFQVTQSNKLLLERGFELYL